MKSQETTNYIFTLRKKLPKNGIKEIANRLGLHHSNVYRVFTGQIENQRVIDEAIKLVDEDNAKKKELAERIKAL